MFKYYTMQGSEFHKINNLKQQFNEILKNRIKSPLPSKKVDILGERITLSRHHIIPLRSLKDFAFTATDVYDDADLSNFLDQHFKLLLMKFKESEICEFYPDQNSQSFHCKYSDPEERALNLMATAFEWLPGNIFYGPPPYMRLDDPGDDFEYNSRYIINYDDTHFLNFNLFTSITRLYTVNELFFINSYKYILKGLDRLLNTDVYNFDIEQWELIDNRFRIQTISQLPKIDPNIYRQPAPPRRLEAISDTDSDDTLHPELEEKKMSCYALKFLEFLENNPDLL